MNRRIVAEVLISAGALTMLVGIGSVFVSFFTGGDYLFGTILSGAVMFGTGRLLSE